MDFSKIEAKLAQAGRKKGAPQGSEDYYHGPEGILTFRDDMRTIFSNCRMFNSPKHFVFRFGETLSRAFESWWEKHNMEDFVESVIRPSGSSASGKPSSTGNKADAKDYIEDAPSLSHHVSKEEEEEDVSGEEDAEDDEGNDENDNGTDEDKNKGRGGGAEESFLPMFDESTKSTADD